MKKMIFILTAFIFCLNIAALSQKTQKTRVGVTGGIAIANLSKTIGGADKDGEYRLGIMCGMQLEVPLCKKFSFQPDLHYIQKGASETSTTPTLNKIYTALRYAELFPNVVYNFKAGKGCFYLGAGPYISFNLPSKKVTHAPGTDKVESEVLFGDAVANDFRGVDYGGNVLMGFRLGNGIFIAANYIQGARNLVPQEVLDLPGNGDNKIKNIAFGIRVGFLFKAASK